MNDCFKRGSIAMIAAASRKALSILLLIIAPLLIAGCLEIETVVHVNRDGSGTITERLVMSKEFVETMQEMAPEGTLADLYNEQELRDATRGYGNGVTYVSAVNVETEFGKGYEATYAFTDVNNIRVGKKPGRKANDETETGTGGFTTFSMYPGNPTQLLIHWPVSENRSDNTEADETVAEDRAFSEQTPEQREAAMAMMQATFKEMRISMHVEVAGQIINSNATHLRNNRVTLVDIAFAEFLNSAEAMEAMATDKEPTVADMKEMLTLIPGLKMEIEPEINVHF